MEILVAEGKYALLAKIVDIAADAIIILDTSQRIAYFSQSAVKTFGYSLDEVLGQPLAMLLPEWARTAHPAHVRTFAQTSEESHWISDRKPLSGRRKNGAEFPCEINIGKLMEDGEPALIAVVRDISKRRKAEEESRFWAHVFANLQTGIVSIEHPGLNILALNPAFAAMHGYTVDELVGKPLQLLLAPSALKQMPEWKSLSQRTSKMTTETTHRRRDGTVFPVETNATDFRDAAGALQYTVLSVEDITGRRASEIALRESEERYRSVFAAQEEGIIVQDASGAIIACNNSAERILGLPREQLLGKTPSQANLWPIHENGQPFLPDDHPSQQALRSGAPETNVLMGIHRPDDTLAWVRANSQPLSRPDEELPNGVVTSMTDVTAQRAAERSLAQQEALLRHVLEVMPVGLWITDRSGKIVSGNEEGRRIWADARHVQIGQGETEMSWWIEAGEPIEPAEWAVKRASESGKPILDELMSIDCFDGSRKLILNSAIPIQDDDGEIINGIVVNQDVTERMTAMQTLEQRVTERTRELTALLELSRETSSTLALQPLLDTVLTRLRSVVDFSGAAIAISDGSTLRVVESQGPVPRDAMIGLSFDLSVDNAYTRVLASERPLILNNVWDDTPWVVRARTQLSPSTLSHFDKTRSWLGVPLMVQAKPIGVLRINSEKADAYTEEHARLVWAFADQVAVAIENARLYDQAQRAAALEERQRLARDLHDSVSQALYGIVLGARTARVLLDRDPPAARQPLDYLLSLSEAAFAEMRALIFELRPDSLATDGVVAAITRRIDVLRSRHDLTVQAELPAEPDLPLEWKDVLYRIVQEATTNVTKHAGASHLDIALRVLDAEIELRISDDGGGFDSDGAFPGHMGLRSMRERAQRLGGTLQVTSSPGAGALVRVRLPKPAASQAS